MKITITKTVVGAPCIKCEGIKIVLFCYYFLMFGDLKLMYETGTSFKFLCRYFYHFSKVNWQRYFYIIEIFKEPTKETK